MTRRRQWRLVAAATQKRRPILEDRRGFLKGSTLFLILLGIVEKIATIGGWTVKDVYESTAAQRPAPMLLAGSATMRLHGSAALTDTESVTVVRTPGNKGRSEVLSV